MSTCNSPSFCQARDDFKEFLWTTHFVPVLQHLRRACATSGSVAVATLPYTALKNLLIGLANVDSDFDPSALLSRLLSDCGIFLSPETSHLIALLHADLHTIFRLRFEIACLRDTLTRMRENFKVCMKEGEARMQEELQEAAALIVRATDLEMGVGVNINS